jgi:hypothetical protein
LTDPDSDNLKAAAEYLLEVARKSEGGRRYRKQPKMDALREYKPEILEAHRHGLNVHRIAEVFRERGVGISKIHLMRAIRRFIEEEERVGNKGSPGQEAPWGKELKSGMTYRVVEQPSAVVREEEFAKQLRIARYLAGAGLAKSRLGSVPEPKSPKQERPVSKAAAKAKSEVARQKAEQAELAKERRRAGRAGKSPSSVRRGMEKQRNSPGR